MGYAEPALPALAAALARCDDLDAVARSAQVEAPALDRFVRGTAIPSASVRARLSAALGVPEVELFVQAAWLRRALRGRHAAASIGVEAAAVATALR